MTDHLALLQGEVVAMAAALDAAEPTREIASCPGWTVADLTAHLTAVHRWVHAALDGASPPPYDEQPASADDYATASSELVARLAELAPDAPCWTFNRDDRTTGFWRRRQLQEVSIHRWDVEQHQLDPVIAGEGIDEVVGFFLPRQLALGRAELPPGSVVLDSGDRRWTLVDGPGPAASVHGTAADLNLLLWGRLDLASVTVDGDAELVTGVFAAGLTP